MTSTSPTPVAGKSLFESRTVWSMIGAMIVYALPSILTKLGVPADQQPAAIGYLQQIATPLLMLLGIMFHSVSTKPVTSMFPTAGTTTKIMGAVVMPLLAAILATCLIAGTLLSACALTPTPQLSPAQQVLAAKTEYVAESAYNVAGNAYLAAEPLLSAAQRTTVKAYLATAYQALLAARHAQVVGDQGTLQTKIDAIQAIVRNVQAITATVGH